MLVIALHVVLQICGIFLSIRQLSAWGIASSEIPTRAADPITATAQSSTIVGVSDFIWISDLLQ